MENNYIPLSIECHGGYGSESSIQFGPILYILVLCKIVKYAIVK